MRIQMRVQDEQINRQTERGGGGGRKERWKGGREVRRKEGREVRRKEGRLVETAITVISNCWE